MDIHQIEEVARQYAEDNYQKSGQRTIAQLSFYAGADWASDTQWHKIDEEMPADRVEVLGILERPHIVSTYILVSAIDGQFVIPGITHWRELPYFSATKTEES